MPDPTLEEPSATAGGDGGAVAAAGADATDAAIDDPAALVERGNVLLEGGRAGEALAWFDRALELAPGEGEARTKRVAALRMAGRSAEAVEAADEILTESPDATFVWNEKGKALYDVDRYVEAVEAFGETLARDGTDRFARLWSTSSLRLAGRPEDALARADELLEEIRDSTLLWNEKGKSLFDLQRYEAAIEAFDRALALDPKDSFARLWKVAALRHGKRCGAALELSEEFLAATPDSVVLWNEKGMALRELGRAAEAVEAFDRALALDPLNGFARAWKLASLRALGDTGEVTGSLEETLSAAREVLVKNPEDLPALRQEVAALRSIRRLDEASERSAAALARHPDDVFLLNEAAALATERGRHREALELLERTLAHDSRNEFALSLRVRVLRVEGRLAEAMEAVDRLPASLRDKPGLLLERGWIAASQGRLAEAETSFRTAVEREPSPEAVYALATALERQRKYEESLDVLLDLERSRPDDLDVREQAGWFYLRRNRLDEAREVFRRIAEADPDHLGGLNARGAMAFTDERYTEAAEIFGQMVARDPWNSTWHSNLAWALVRIDEGGPRAARPAGPRFGRGQASAPPRLEDAARHCRRALALDPLYPAAHGCLGVIAFKQGRLQEAESHFLRSMERDRLEGSLADLGALWAEIGKVEQSEEILRESLAANPDDPTARVELGSLLLGLGRTDEAIRQLRQAVAYAPESPRPARALALALIEGKRWHEAEEVLRRAIVRIEPHRAWQLHLTLAHLLVQRGDESDADSQLYEEARRAVDEARRLRPEDPEVCFQAGVVWYRLEAYGRSLRNFRRCAELDPEQFEAVRNVERLRRLQRRARLQERGGVWASLLLVVVSLLQLVGAWALFLYERLAEGSLLSVASISLGLLVVALLLPWLSRLKLPGGFEAQLAERTPAISPGPSGEASFGGESAPRSRAAVSRGPY